MTDNLTKANLSDYVNDMIQLSTFKGLAKYIVNITFWWSNSIKTACAGDGFIYFNPNFWDKLTEEERKTVIAHEIWHLVLNHLNRVIDKDHEIYNIAADYVINNILNESDFYVSTDPDSFGGIGICHDTKYKNRGTNDIYNEIYQDVQKQRKQHKSVQNTSFDQIKDLIKQTLQKIKEEETGNKNVQITNYDVSKNQKENEEKLKTVSASAVIQDGLTYTVLLRENFYKTVQNKTYKEIFNKYLTDPLSGGKRTFLRPSRRQSSSNLRMKGQFPKRGKENRLTHLVYALDVSGSISQKIANDFLSSAGSLKTILNPNLMTVMLWDTKIVFEKVFKENEDLNNIHVHAGGGTNLTPVYNRLKILKPEAVVIYTDLQVSIPPKPDCDVLWFVPDQNVRTDHVTYGDIYKITKETK